ncbi:MAG TPA: hypothetical protein VEA69_07310 [Tepidisphaeraceae bacterium]|nr:hypothetical protein [Tepidisphaeraceae bacterium]
MSKSTKGIGRTDAYAALRQNGMMRHLLESLEAGKDVGHYGRLVFAMVGRHFLDADELAALLAKGQGLDDVQARALVHQVESRGYNPPRREKIAEWQKEQEFPICPGGDDPDACNLYRNLKFPDGVYEKIEEYHEAKVGQ